MSEFDLSLSRPPTDLEAAEFAALGLTPGHWAALAPAPLFRNDLRSPERADFKTFHQLRLFLRTIRNLAAEAELFWQRLRDASSETLEIAYALLGWHLAYDLERPKREEFLLRLDRTAQTRRLRTEKQVSVERDVRRWIDAYLPVPAYTRNPPLSRPDPPDPAEVAKILGRDLWKQLLLAPVAAALRAGNVEPDVVHRMVQRLSQVTEADPAVTAHPLELHITPGWQRLFAPLLSPARAPSALPLDESMRIAARGLASLEFGERETILAALRLEIQSASVNEHAEVVAAGWIDRIREMIEEELLAFTPRPGVVDAVLVMPKPAPEIEPPVVKARTWLCGHCGIDNARTETQCAGCGLAALPALVLRSIATGREEEVRTPRRLGRQVFDRRLGDPDSRFASELQFELLHDESASVWIIRPWPETRNPTFYNGMPLAPVGCQLADGGVISIGKSKLKLRVRVSRD
jgi:hypothetical protein